jgi:hypothetical protein
MTAKAAKAPTKKPKTTKPKSKPAVVSKPQAIEKKAEKKVDGKKSLRLWNIRLGLVLVAVAVAVVVAGKTTSVPLTVQHLAKDALATEVAGHDVFAPATRHLFDVHVSWLVAKFLVLVAAVYVLTATVWRKKYEAWLEQGVNPLRWVAYGAGGGAAVVTVAMLSGVSDISELMLIFGSVALAALLVTAIELIPSGRMLRRSLGIGAIVATFLPLLIFVRAAGAVPLFAGDLPVYLYFVYAVVVLFAVATGFAAYLSAKKKGKWADAFYAERMVLVLGFLASVVLALQIFAGALQP